MISRKGASLQSVIIFSLICFLAITLQALNNKVSVDDLDVSIALKQLENGDLILVNLKDTMVSRSIIETGYWEKGEHDFLSKLLKPGNIVVEVGGNWGVHTLHMSRIIGNKGHIYSFEVRPDIAKYLGLTLKLNEIKNVDIIQKAAYSSEGEMDFELNSFDYGKSRLISPKDIEVKFTKIKVPTVSIDYELADVRNVDLLRMDAEGSEIMIIKGAKKLIENSPKLIILMEWHEHFMNLHADVPELINLLKSYGFSAYSLNLRNGKIAPIDSDSLATLNNMEILWSRNNEFSKDL